MNAAMNVPPRPEVRAFLDDIKEHSWEDAPRLILADWLEEYGDPLDQARAELIRCQVQGSRLPAGSTARQELARRARQLQQQHSRSWLGPLADWLGHSFAHQRGLLSVRLPLAQVRRKALAALAGTE